MIYINFLEKVDENGSKRLKKMEMKTKKQKQREINILAKTIILPIIIGFALVYANITIAFFKIIGWILLIFGILSGSLYLFKLYRIHKEKVKKTKEELLKLIKK